MVDRPPLPDILEHSPSPSTRRAHSLSNASRNSDNSSDKQCSSAKEKMQQQFLRPRWVKDEEVTNCYICKSPFTLLRRKHHCRACGQIVCQSCSPNMLPLTHLGYLDLQRVCDHCVPFISTVKKKKRIHSDTSVFERPSAPIARSSIVLFSPPVTPHVVYDEESDACIELENRLFYYDFDMVFDNKVYIDTQVSVSRDRILIIDGTSKKHRPPFRTVFYRDVLAVSKSEKSSKVSIIFWYPWLGTEENRIRKEQKIITKHSSESERDKFQSTLSNYIKYSNNLPPHEVRKRDSMKLLVLVNPKSGSGGAWSIYKSIVKMFEKAKIEFDPYYLKNTKHAFTLLMESDVSPYFAIACCGGDGLMHYTIDALTRLGKKIPVFCIPAGHGIGIAASILAHASPVSASFCIAKGFRRKLDLLKVSQNGTLLAHCSLLLAWGIVATVEFETAGMRWMGPIRYRLGAIAAITNPPLFHLKISYVAASDQTMTFCTGEGCRRCEEGTLLSQQNTNTVEDEWEVEEGYFIMASVMNLSDSTQNHRIAPYAHASDGCVDLVFIKDISRTSFLELYKTLSTGAFVNKSNFYMHDKLGYIKVKKLKIEYLDGECAASIDGIPYKHNSVFECEVIPSAFSLGS